ncbi:MAG: hypothetical protein L6461_14680, partial [Anaerolineae bacterium]|nr:hypothetical protein [Anaerolineae bacterium]
MKEKFMTELSQTKKEEPRPMTNWWNIFVNFLTSPSNSVTEVGNRRRAQLTSGLILIVSLLSAIGVTFGRAESRAFLLSAIGISALAYLISRTKYFSWGAFLFLLSLSAIPFITILTSPESGQIEVRIYSWIPLALVIASVLVNRWALFLFTGLTVGATISLVIIYPDYSRSIAQISGIITTIGFLLIYLEAFRASVEKERLGELQKT